MGSATVEVNREAILDLVRVKDEFDSIIESLELMSNPEFMVSYKKSKEQVEKRDFVDWNDLKLFSKEKLLLSIKRSLKDAAQGKLRER
ncbi:MAG: hypothetical protein KKH52_03315 [Nanoarchaeota archaeon]|nr:hypothetical protein [Nanoarchaeota archaeon]MBU1623097.1 hypothetical protein [Nanoarchaeota archaeon]MBU1974397.1 hypothetical protein [Nanoarchaeota archaeon]